MQPDSIPDAEIALAIKQARKQAHAFLQKVPLHFDHDAFLGEAALAVAVALGTWDEKRGPFLPHAGAHVKRALLDEMRRQEPMGRYGFSKMKREGFDRPPQFQVPHRLEWLAQETERELPDTDIDVEALAILAVFREAVITAVNSLPPKYRKAVVARFWSELTWDDTGAECGISWQGAMLRVASAKPILREALEGWIDAPG